MAVPRLGEGFEGSDYMYCEQCGAKLEPESKFCPSCGSPVAHASGNAVSESHIQDPFNQSSNTEEVVWVLTAQRKESFFKRTTCFLIFMKDKLIVAHLSAQRQKEESAKVSSEIKAQGKGFFKGSAEMMQHWANYHKKYYSMASGHILAEDPTNFSIPYMNINKLVYQCESTDIDADGSSSGHQGKLDISLFDGKNIKFSHTHSHDSTIKKTLIELFGKTLKYRK